MRINTRTRRRAALGLATAAVGAVLLSACIPSPTMTTTDAEGNTVTVDWVEYPANAGIPADDVLNGRHKTKTAGIRKLATATAAHHS